MSLIHEIDYGTPASKSQKMVTLTVDGVSVTVTGILPDFDCILSLCRRK